MFPRWQGSQRRSRGGRSLCGTHRLDGHRSASRFYWVSFLLPALQAVKHLIDPKAQSTEHCCALRGRVAEYSRAVGDEDLVLGQSRRRLSADGSVGQVDGTGNMTPCISLRRPSVNHNETSLTLLKVSVDIGRVRLKAQLGAKVLCRSSWVRNLRFQNSRGLPGLTHGHRSCGHSTSDQNPCPQNISVEQRTC